MPNMHYQSRLFIAYALVFICIDAFFSLFYFWSAQLSYGLLIVGSSLYLARRHTLWRGSLARTKCFSLCCFWDTLSTYYSFTLCPTIPMA